MSIGTLWWVCAGALVVAELLTGTFYLLMIACGCIAGGIAALAAGSPALQYLAAACVALGGLAAVYRIKRRSAWPAKAIANRDVNLDIGQSLYIAKWHGRRSRANYRGTQWDVERAADTPAVAGWYQIVAIRDNRLVVAAPMDQEKLSGLEK